MARRNLRKTTRARQSTPEPTLSGPPEGWVLGKTCLTCRTTYRNWTAEFQDEDAKDGKWDVFKQLPHTAPDYPICPNCLPRHWQIGAARWGMVKQVKEAYG